MDPEILNPAEEPAKDGGTPAEGVEKEGTQEQKIKIGESEYTPEELNSALKESKSYKDLLPEFTKKSQALAALLGNDNKQINNGQDTPSFLKEGWKPKNFSELGQALKEATEWGQKSYEKKQQQAQEQAKQAKEQVDNFVKEVKAKNKDFDDKEFFQYVQRHGFKVNNAEDLKSHFSAYMEANLDGKLAERRALANKTLRNNDGVSKPGSNGSGTSFDATSLRTQGGSIRESALEAFAKLKG